MQSLVTTHWLHINLESQSPIYEYVVDCLNCSQCVLRSQIRYICTRTRSLATHNSQIITNKLRRKLTCICDPAYCVLWFITTLCIFPNLPKQSGFFKISGSASRGDSPTTNTKFFWTTRTLARCFLFSVIFCFLAWSFCLFSACNRNLSVQYLFHPSTPPVFTLILAISSEVRGLKSAGFSVYPCLQAGHKPLPSVRSLFQQKRQIWE